MSLSRTVFAAILACVALGQSALAGVTDNSSTTTLVSVTDWLPDTPTIDHVAIRDQTSVKNMTPRAMTVLFGASQAASAVGLARIDILAARGGGHLSHSSG